jgi:hypothetical protein
MIGITPSFSLISLYSYIYEATVALQLQQFLVDYSYIDQLEVVDWSN